MVARTAIAFFPEDCSPMFRLSIVLFTICKHVHAHEHRGKRL